MNIKMLKAAVAGLILSVSGFANAGIINITEVAFDGLLTENFDAYSEGYYDSESIFDGNSILTGTGSAAPNEYYIASEGRWGLNSTNNGWTNVIANSGSNFLTIYGLGYIDIDFSLDAYSFGGYFADIYVNEDTTFDFYDNSSNLIQSFTMDFQSLAGEMTWAGFSSDIAFSSVRITGNETAIDSLRAGITTDVPEPTTLAIFALGIMGLASRRFKKQ